MIPRRTTKIWVPALQGAKEIRTAGGRKAIENGFKQPFHFGLGLIELGRESVIPHGQCDQQPFQFRIHAKAHRKMRSASSEDMSVCHRASLSSKWRNRALTRAGTAGSGKSG